MTTIFEKRSAHGMFIFIVFAVVTTSMVLIAFIRVTADMDDMQNSSTFSARREYLK